jgi:large subunit ribosomal protein L17
VAARRRCIELLGDKRAVGILFEDIAPRFAERPGGYTRIIRLAQPRLGDAGTQAILEFVGVRDRVVQRSQKPAFEDNEPLPAKAPAPPEPATEPQAETAPAESAPPQSPAAE